MNMQRYKQFRAAAVLFMATVVGVAVWLNLYLLAAVGLLTGLLFLALVRARAKITIDERERTIREKAAAATVGIFAATIGISAVLLLLFATRGYLYIEALGLLFAYLTLFLIALYALSYHFFNRKYGGGGDEE